VNRLILAAALAAGCSLAPSAPALAAAKHYDCSKAGNANKSACKSAATNTAATPKATKAEAKAAKSEAKATKPEAKAASAKPSSPSILQRMSNVFAGGKAAPPPRPAAAQKRTAAAAPASVEDRNPAGAIAQCKDGTYSHAKARSGACSRHGGVGKWS
jgi:hypothetical protein